MVVIFLGVAMAQEDPLTVRSRPLRNTVRLTLAYRKYRCLTLETLSGLSNLSKRFLSEFERDKQTAEIGTVLKALQTLG
jgi:hypothetical protein